MAETFGVVAAAFQITDSAIKLSKVWVDIKGMPETVRAIVEDVNLLADTLQRILQIDPLLQTSIASTTCFRTLQKVNSEFKNFVDDLNSQITVHKKTGSFKAFLKREKLTEYRARLESLKTNMLLLQHERTTATMAQHFSMVMQAIQTQRLLEPSDPRTAVGMVSATDVEDTDEVSEESPAGKLKWPLQRRTSRRSAQRFEFYLPHWMSWKRMQLLVDHSHGSWTVNLRVYNKLPKGSEVFRHAGAGRWCEVQRMFTEKRASPFDVTESGFTLLHLAAKDGDVNGCRLLLDYGLEPYPQLGSGFSPLAYCSSYFASGEAANRMEVLRLLSTSFNDDVLDDSCARLPFEELSLEAVRYLVTMDTSVYHLVEPRRRARTMSYFRGPDPESIALILGPQLSFSRALEILAEDPSPLWWNHRYIFFDICTRFASVMADENKVRCFLENWRPFVAEIILQERQASQCLQFWSFLTNIINNCLSAKHMILRSDEPGPVWTQKLSRPVRVWIGALIEWGVDIKVYAAAERRLFLETYPKFLREWHGPDRPFSMRINGFSCGPNVEHWAIYAVPAFISPGNPDKEYEMAGDFWRWIENPELFSLPGAYLDEYDGSDKPPGISPFKYRTAGPIL